MPVRKTMQLSKGKLTFACDQVYELLYEIEKVWRGTMSIAIVWRFNNMALLKSKQLAASCPSVIAKARQCLKNTATEAYVSDFVERSVRYYYLMRQRPFLKRIYDAYAGGLVQHCELSWVLFQITQTKTKNINVNKRKVRAQSTMPTVERR